MMIRITSYPVGQIHNIVRVIRAQDGHYPGSLQRAMNFAHGEFASDCVESTIQALRDMGCELLTGEDATNPEALAEMKHRKEEEYRRSLEAQVEALGGRIVWPVKEKEESK